MPETAKHDSPYPPEQAIFLEALKKTSPDERAKYLDEACGGDTALRSEVEGILSSHEKAGAGFMGQPVAVLANPPTVDLKPLIDDSGKVIGN